MRIDILTLFPEMCKTVNSESIIGRAQKNGFLDIRYHNIRDYAFDKHKRVDDTPYGGGRGMVMLAEPIMRCYEDLCKDFCKRPRLIYMSAQGGVLKEETAVRLSKLDNLAILCGHYEGVDERVLEEIVDEEISIGDYVLTGGELPALVLIDVISRLVDGVLPDKECFEKESHYSGMLEHPQYTKPANWRGKQVPEVLLSGHHANINKWKYEESLKRTRERREDMLK